MSIYDGHPGITEDQYGIRASVTVGSGPTKRQKVKRFKRGAALKSITDWQDRTRVALRDDPQVARKGRLDADVAHYLTHQKVQLVKSSYASLVCELNAWLEPFGHLTRDAITRDQVLEQRRRWLTEPRGGPLARTGTRDALPHAPKTCNHRLRALAGLYHFLDGSRAPTPCDDVPKLREPEPDPKFVPVATVKAVFANLTDPKTRARFMVLVSTGQRPAQLKRATSEDVDLERGVWLVRPAKGGKAVPVILTDDMQIAWMAFAGADAWGEFDGSEYAKALYAAGWPAGIRPYNAKHTLAITLGEAGVGWEDMRDWFGHQDVKTTRIYAGHILARTRATAKHLEGRIGWVEPGLVATSPNSPPAKTGSRTGSRESRNGTHLVKTRRNLTQAKNGPATSVSAGKRCV